MMTTVRGITKSALTDGFRMFINTLDLYILHFICRMFDFL